MSQPTEMFLSLGSVYSASDKYGPFILELMAPAITQLDANVHLSHTSPERDYLVTQLDKCVHAGHWPHLSVRFGR